MVSCSWCSPLVVARCQQPFQSALARHPSTIQGGAVPLLCQLVPACVFAGSREVSAALRCRLRTGVGLVRPVVPAHRALIGEQDTAGFSSGCSLSVLASTSCCLVVVSPPHLLLNHRHYPSVNRQGTPSLLAQRLNLWAFASTNGKGSLFPTS